MKYSDIKKNPLGLTKEQETQLIERARSDDSLLSEAVQCYFILMAEEAAEEAKKNEPKISFDERFVELLEEAQMNSDDAAVILKELYMLIVNEAKVDDSFLAEMAKKYLELVVSDVLMVKQSREGLPRQKTVGMKNVVYDDENRIIGIEDIRYEQ